MNTPTEFSDEDEPGVEPYQYCRSGEASPCLKAQKSSTHERPPFVPKIDISSTLQEPPVTQPRTSTRASKKTSREVIFEQYIKSSNAIYEQLTQMTRVFDDQLKQAITMIITNKTYTMRDYFSVSAAKNADDQITRLNRMHKLLFDVPSAHFISPPIAGNAESIAHFLQTEIVPYKLSGTQFANPDERLTLQQFIDSGDLEKILRLHSPFLPTNQQDKFKRFTTEFFEHVCIDNSQYQSVLQAVADKRIFYVRDQFSPNAVTESTIQDQRALDLLTICRKTKTAHLITPPNKNDPTHVSFLQTLIQPIPTGSTKYDNPTEEMTIAEFTSCSDLEMLLRLNSYFLPGSRSVYRDQYEHCAKELIKIFESELKTHNIPTEDYDTLNLLMEFITPFIKVTILTIIYVHSYCQLTFTRISGIQDEQHFSLSLKDHEAVLLSKSKILSLWLHDDYFKPIRENILDDIHSFNDADDFADNFTQLRFALDNLIDTCRKPIEPIKENANSPFSMVAGHLIGVFDTTTQCLENITLALKNHFKDAASAVEKEAGQFTQRGGKITSQPNSGRSANNSGRKKEIVLSQNSVGSTSTPPRSGASSPNVPRSKSTQPPDAQSDQSTAENRGSLRESAPATVYKNAVSDESNNTQLLKFLTKHTQPSGKKGGYREKLAPNSNTSVRKSPVYKPN